MTENMVLQQRDINLLLSNGYLQRDIKQIQEAIKKTEYTQYELQPPYTIVKKLTAAEAYKKLGREKFLSGIGRSAFHFTASREYSKKYGVMFDSHKLFK